MHKTGAAWTVFARRRVIASVLVFVAALYIGLGAFFWRVDDSGPDRIQTVFWRNPTVGIMSDLLYRELIKNPWLPNKPPFLPGILGTGRPAAFQTGIVEGVAAAADYLSLLFPDSAGLSLAAGYLKYPPDIGFFTFSRSHPATSHRVYRDALKVLDGVSLMEKYSLDAPRETALLTALADGLRSWSVPESGGAAEFWRRRGRLYAARAVFMTMTERPPEIAEAFDRAVGYKAPFVFHNHMLTQSRYAELIAESVDVYLEKRYGNAGRTTD